MPSLFRTRYTVGWHYAAEVDDDADPYGDADVTYTPPLSNEDGPVAGTPVKVYAWAPPGARGTPEPDPNRVIHDLDLYVPPGTLGNPRDVVDLPNGRYEVVGWPLDYTTGPFAPGMGGLVVQLKRVTQ